MNRSGRLLAGTRDSGAYILGVGVHNAATARLVERAGFGVLWLSSLEISTAKALPDANVITSVEVSEIIARTEALVAGLGVAEAVERARAYVEAGADAIFVQTNTSTIAEFEWVLGEIHMFAPIVIAPTALPNVPAARLHGLGADVII